MKKLLITSFVAMVCSAAFAGRGAGGPGLGDFRLTFMRYDTNHDGTLSSAELTAASQALAQQLQTHVLNRYDTNSDGTITAAEALAVHQNTVH